MEAQYDEKSDMWFSRPRQTVKSITAELRKGGWSGRSWHFEGPWDKYGHRVRDPTKYSETNDRTLARDIETIELKAWGAPRKRKKGAVRKKK